MSTIRSKVCAGSLLSMAIALGGLQTGLGQESDSVMMSSQDGQIIYFTSAVHAGDESSLTIHTFPHMKCKLEFPGQQNVKVEGTDTPSADNKGMVSWKWQIPKDYKAEILPFIVTFNPGGREDKLANCVRILGNNGPRIRISDHPTRISSGAPFSFMIKTTPGAKCSISIPGFEPIDPKSLAPQKANPEGVALWSFKLKPGFTSAKMPVIITSDKGNNESKRLALIDVVRRTASGGLTH